MNKEPAKVLLNKKTKGKINMLEALVILFGILILVGLDRINRSIQKLK